MENKDISQYTPSRFLIKKQQAMQQQSQKLKSLSSDKRIPEQLTKPRFVPNTNIPQKREVRELSSHSNDEIQQPKINEQNLLLHESSVSNNRNSFQGKKSIDPKKLVITLGGIGNEKMSLKNKQPNTDSQYVKDDDYKDLQKIQIEYKIFQPQEYPNKIIVQSEQLTKEEKVYNGFQECIEKDEMMLFQLPTMLPFKECIKKEVTQEIQIENSENMNELLKFMINNKFDSSGQPITYDYNNLIQPPLLTSDELKNLSGSMNFSAYSLGKLKISKQSKSVQLKLGEVDFDIMKGAESEFLQEACAFETSKDKINAAYFLSDVNHQFIIKPRLTE